MKAVFASTKTGAFGYKGALPWAPIPEDFKHFKDITMGKHIVMGRVTWETLPKLKGRYPVVVSHITIPDTLSLPIENLDRYLEALEYELEDEVILIGGATLLTVPLLRKCTEIYHTEVKGGGYRADTYIHDSVLDYLDSLDYIVVEETDRCIIRKYFHA